MQQKFCTPLTSDYLSRHSSAEQAHEGADAVTQRVRERVCDDGRGVSLIHQCAASLYQSAAMLLIQPSEVHAHITTSVYFKTNCVMQQKWAELPNKCSTSLSHYLFILLCLCVRAWEGCRGMILQCSPTPCFTLVPHSGCNNTFSVETDRNYEKVGQRKVSVNQWCNKGKSGHDTYCGHMWSDPVSSFQNLQTSPYRLNRIEKWKKRDYTHIFHEAGHFE